MMKKNRKITTGFSLVEMMISLGIFSFVALAVISGSMQIGKSIEKTRVCITSRQELATFSQGIYSFINKSKGAYFWDTDTNAEMNYLTKFSALPSDSTMFDILFLVKDTANNTGSIVYDPANHTITWFRTTGVSGDVMLTNVYRYDYENDTNPGVEPVFKFPHRSDLYVSSTRPNFVVIQFRKKISDSTSINPNPVTVPVKLMFQLNTIN